LSGWRCCWPRSSWPGSGSPSSGSSSDGCTARPRAFCRRPGGTTFLLRGFTLLLIGLTTVPFGAVTQGIPFALGNFQVGRYQYAQYRIVMTALAAGLMVGVYVLLRYHAFRRRV